jgi:hypothetical protein
MTWLKDYFGQPCGIPRPDYKGQVVQLVGLLSDSNS